MGKSRVVFPQIHASGSGNLLVLHERQWVCLPAFISQYEMWGCKCGLPLPRKEESSWVKDEREIIVCRVFMCTGASSVPGAQVWSCLQLCPRVLPMNCAGDGPVKNQHTCMEDGLPDVTFGCTCTREVFIPLYRSLCTLSSLNLKTKTQQLPSEASKPFLIILLILSNNTLSNKQLHRFGRVSCAMCSIKALHKCKCFYSSTEEEVTNLHVNWFH